MDKGFTSPNTMVIAIDFLYKCQLKLLKEKTKVPTIKIQKNISKFLLENILRFVLNISPGRGLVL